MAKRKASLKELQPMTQQEINRMVNSTKPARSRTMAAARAHRGEVWVKDPMLLL